MHISNKDGWTLSFQNNNLIVSDPTGKKIDNPVFLSDNGVLSGCQAVDKIASLIKRSFNPYSFQAFRQQDKVAIVIGSYGLQGGGKVEALAASIAGLVAGVALSFKNRRAGQALVVSSFNAAMYAYKTPEDKFSEKECLARAAIAGTTSVAASVLGDTIRGPIQSAIADPLAAQIVSQSVVTLAQEGASQAIKGELDLAKMAVSIASGSAGIAVGERVSELIDAKEVSELILKTSASGMASASVSALTEDLLTGQPLSNIPAAALSAGVLSSLNSVPGAFEISAAIQAREEAQKNIPVPPEPPKAPKPPEAPEPLSPPKKPDLSALNLEKRKQEIEAKEKEVAAKETAYSTAFENAKTWVASKLKQGFYDRATWAKTPEATAGRILNGEKVKMRRDLGGMDHNYKIKQEKVVNPTQERSALDSAKAALAKDENYAKNVLAAYDASLKAYDQERINRMAAYDTSLKAYQQEKDRQFIYCPGPIAPPPAVPKMQQLPVVNLRVEEDREHLARQLELRPSIEYSFRAEIPYRIESTERVDRAQQAVIGSHAPKIAMASINEAVRPSRGVIHKGVIHREQPLRESLAEKQIAIEKTKNHIANLQNQKNHAPKSAREKKQALTQQIDAHNKRLENLQKN